MSNGGKSSRPESDYERALRLRKEWMLNRSGVRGPLTRLRANELEKDGDIDVRMRPQYQPKKEPRMVKKKYKIVYTNELGDF